jgi:hypothetical protein
MPSWPKRKTRTNEKRSAGKNPSMAILEGFSCHILSLILEMIAISGMRYIFLEK